jgi:multimeric flavodoxin WrbA
MTTKILGICGSPRKSGTEYALTEALAAAAEVEDVEVELITLRGKKINFCIHCNKCIKDEKPFCTIYEDDMTPLYEKFFEADGYIIASPVYEMNITAQLAAFFNRFRANYILLKDNPHFFSSKVGGAISVGGVRNGGQECTINAIHNFYHTMGIEVVNGGMGAYAGASIWSQDRKVEGVQEDEQGVKNARLIGKKVAAMAKIVKDLQIK